LLNSNPIHIGLKAVGEIKKDAEEKEEFTRQVF